MRAAVAAYTHIVPISRPKLPAPAMTELVAQRRETYGGPLERGRI